MGRRLGEVRRVPSRPWAVRWPACAGVGAHGVVAVEDWLGRVTRSVLGSVSGGRMRRGRGRVLTFPSSGRPLALLRVLMVLGMLGRRRGRGTGLVMRAWGTSVGVVPLVGRTSRPRPRLDGVGRCRVGQTVVRVVRMVMGLGLGTLPLVTRMRL